MFSTDQNIETLAQLVEALKQYSSLKLSQAKLTFVEKAVKITTILIIAFALMLTSAMVIIFLSIAAAIAIGYAIDSMVAGFLIVAACHFFLFLMVVTLRKSLIERPIVNLLLKILLDKAQ